MDQIAAGKVDQRSGGMILFAQKGRSWKLTTRETDTLKELLTGASNKEIGDRLQLTRGTVGVYLTHVRQKLRLSTRVGLALWAERSGTFRVSAADPDSLC